MLESIGMLIIFVFYAYSIFLPLKLGTSWFSAGLLIYLLGILVVILGLLSFHTTPVDKPVTKWVYRISRHPMYVGDILVDIGISIACLSWIFLLLVIVVVILYPHSVTPEESICLNQYGDAYREYMNRTPRWIGIPKSEKKDRPKHTKLATPVLAALLDFYSDRATAHASFVVASTFGIYTVLFAGLDALGPFLFGLVFLVLVFVGGYSFLNFGYYAFAAQLIRVDLLGKKREDHDEEMRLRITESSRSLRVFENFKSKIVLSPKRRYLFFFILWFCAVVLPFIWICATDIFHILNNA